MIRFQNHQYSVSPNYIGKEVEIKPTTDGKTIRIFYQGVEIQKHDLTISSLITIFMINTPFLKVI